jgi:SHS2 domain-containing protein
MPRPFEIIEHTADAAIRAHGATREELFANAAAGMLAVIGGRDTVRATETRPVHVTAGDPAGLLAAFLSELLFLLETGPFATHHVTVDELTDREIGATAHGEPLAEHHGLETEIKAVTHHELAVEQTADGWAARVLFDL